MKISPGDIAFLRLIERSPDTGQGWRDVSEALWRLVVNFPHQELIESVNKDVGGSVRLSDKGKTVTEYV